MRLKPTARQNFKDHQGRTRFGLVSPPCHEEHPLYPVLRGDYGKARRRSNNRNCQRQFPPNTDYARQRDRCPGTLSQGRRRDEADYIVRVLRLPFFRLAIVDECIAKRKRRELSVRQREFLPAGNGRRGLSLKALETAHEKAKTLRNGACRSLYLQDPCPGVQYKRVENRNLNGRMPLTLNTRRTWNWWNG